MTKEDGGIKKFKMDEEEIKKIKEKIEVAKRIAEAEGEPYRKEIFLVVLEELIKKRKKVKEFTERDEEIIEDRNVPPQILARSCRKAILELLDSAWGRKVPRTLQEIKKALEINALYFPSSTVPAALNQLTKTNKVRRLKREGVFAYVLSN